MEQPVLAEICALTEALLALARLPNPDLGEAGLLLQSRGQLISLLPAPSPEERDEWRSTLFQLQAADAEVRARLQGRQRRVGAELTILAKHVARHPPERRQPRLLDHRV